jgi:hypothetical protein
MFMPLTHGSATQRVRRLLEAGTPDTPTGPWISEAAPTRTLHIGKAPPAVPHVPGVGIILRSSSILPERSEEQRALFKRWRDSIGVFVHGRHQHRLHLRCSPGAPGADRHSCRINAGPSPVRSGRQAGRSLSGAGRARSGQAGPAHRGTSWRRRARHADARSPGSSGGAAGHDRSRA